MRFKCVFIVFTLPLLLLTILPLTNLALGSYTPGAETKIKVIDSATGSNEIINQYNVGETFTVNVNVSDVENLRLYQAGLTFDPDILEVTSFVAGDFFLEAPEEYRKSIVNQPILSDGIGYLGKWVHVAWALKKPGNVTGTGTLAVITFHVIGEGKTDLHIITTGAEGAVLYDPNDVDLNFDTINGRFVLSPLVPPANIYVTPPTSTVETINDTFKINITISDVNLLTSWQAGVSFNPDVLECLAFEEGHFLSSVGTTVAERLGADAEIDNFLGEVAPANCSLTDPSLSVNGTGTLAVVTFKAKDYGMSILNVTDVMLLDVNDEEIFFNAAGGEFVFLSIVDVPADYPTIQEAVNSASPGQTIQVAAGTYYEHVTINKSLTLIGKKGATIDGSGGGNVINITTNNISISGFTIRNGRFGIYLKGSNNSIARNTISNNWCGVYMVNSKHNSISGNTITSNDVFGIRMFGSCSNNIVLTNMFAHSKIGISLAHANNNTFYHNEIIDNEFQLERYKCSNTWDNGAGEGNYWSDYTGLDDGSDGRVAGDGVGDTDLPHQGVDYYPLMSQLGIRPQADAGPDQTVDEDTSVNFDGSNSTGDTSITSYAWNFGDGTPTVSETDPITTHIYTQPGVYTVILTVWDEADNEDTDSCTVTVLDVTPPVADAGLDQTVDEDTIVTFEASASYDPEGGTITKYEWNFGDGASGTGVTPTHIYTEPGVYTVTLTVWDAGPWRNGTGLLRNDTASCAITVTGGDVEPPKADAGPDQTVDEDTLVTFNGSGSTDNFGITSHTWTFTDVTVQILTGVNPTYTFAEPAAYTVTLNVTDAAGYWAIDTVVITVLDVTPPVADAGSEQKVMVGETVVFNGSGSTDNVGVVSFEWDFGDETTGTGSIINHIYTEQGEYTVTLTVKDAAGNSATDSIIIHVKTPPSGFPLWIVGATATVVALIALGALIALFVLGRRKRETNENLNMVACAFWALRATCEEGD